MEENPDVSEMLNKMKEALLTNEETNKILENSKRELKESKDLCNEVVKEVYLSAVKTLEEAFEETKNQVQHKHDNLRDRQEVKQKILQRSNLALSLEIVELAGSKCDEGSVRKYEDVLDSCREALNMRKVDHNVVFNFIPNPKLKPKLGVLQLCDNLPSDFKLSLLTQMNRIAIGKQVSCAIQGELTEENLQHLEFCIRLDTHIIAPETTKVEEKMVTFCFRPDSGGVYSVMVQLFGLNIVASPLSVLVPLTNVNEDSTSYSTPHCTNEESKIMPTPHETYRESATTNDVQEESLSRDNSTQSHTGEVETTLENVKKIDEEKSIESKATVADVSVSVAEDEVADIEETTTHEELSALDSNHNRFDEAGDRLADDTTWKVGDRCIARWEEDEVWYRAEVKKQQPDGVLVSFIDYGNSAVVTRLVNMFLEIPHTDAYDDNVIPTESQDENQNSLKDTTVKIENESVRVVNLPEKADNQAIPVAADNQVIPIEAEDQAIPIEAEDQSIPIEAEDQSIPIEADNQAIPVVESKFSVGDVCSAKWEEDQVWYNCAVENILGDGRYIVNFVDYGNSEVVAEPFIVNTGADIPKEVPKEQIDSNVNTNVFKIDQLIDIQDNKTEAPKELVKLTNDDVFIPSVGEICVARWENDKIWYNAQVEEQNEDGTFGVNFIDYGNTEIVCRPFVVKSASNIPEDVAKENIDEHVVVNRNQSKSQAHEYSFSKMSAETGGGKKLEDVTTCESSLFSVGDVCIARWAEDGIFYNAIVTTVLSDGSYSVMFADYGNTATVEPANVVRNANELPTETTRDHVDIHVKFVESCIENKERCLEDTKNLGEKAASKFSVGQTCVVRWAQDLVWYNGKIVHDNKDGSYFVEFVDYGNTETVESLYIIEDGSEILFTVGSDYIDENVDKRMRGTEIVIKHDSAKDVTNIELQSSSVSSVMKDNINTQDEGKDAVENSIVEDHHQVKSNIVDVKYDHEEENAKRSTKKREKSTPAVPRPLKEVPSAVEQTANDISQTQEKNDISQTQEKHVSGQMEVIHAWRHGDNCLALWSEDSVWYRAVVKRRNSNGTYTVTFYDYGNEEDVQPFGMVLDHLALLATGKQCVVDVNVEVDEDYILSCDDVEESRALNKPFDMHVKKKVQSIEKECKKPLDVANIASSFGFDSNPVSPSSQNPETDVKPSSLSVEARSMNGSLNLLEMVTDFPRGGHVLPAKEVLHISDVKGPIGITVLRNKNILITSSWDNSVKMFNARGEIIAPIQSRRPFKRPSDTFTLSTGEFVVRDDIGLRLFTEKGAFVKDIGQGQIDKCYGVTEDDEGHIVTVNVVRASENSKSGSKGKGGLTDVGETDIFYIDRESGEVVKEIYLIDVIQDKSKSKCRFINFHEENVYIVDLGLDCIYILDTKGIQAESFGTPGRGKGQFQDPAGLVVDDWGNMIVADSRNHRLQIFNSDSEYVGDVQVDKPLNRPSGIYLDKQCKELYVLNYWGNSMTKYRIG